MVEEDRLVEMVFQEQQILEVVLVLVQTTKTVQLVVQV